MTRLLLKSKMRSAWFTAGNRYYDPDTGWLTQEDPIGLAGGLNLYGYANGDPVNFSDPFGLCPWCIGAAAGIAVEGAIQLYTGEFNGGRLLAAGVLGAASGGLSVAAKVGTGAKVAGQMLLGGLGGLSGEGLDGDGLNGNGFAAFGTGMVLGAAGEGAGSFLSKALKTQAAQGAIRDATNVIQARIMLSTDAADAQMMWRAIHTMGNSAESELAGGVIGLTVGLGGGGTGENR